MVGPIDLIRRNSKKFKQKLTKKNGKSQIATIKPVNSNDTNIPFSNSMPNLSVILKRSSSKSRSNVSFDLPAFEEVPFINEEYSSLPSISVTTSNDYQTSTRSRSNTSDQVGTLIDIRKKRGLSTSPPPKRRGNRFSLDDQLLQQQDRSISRRVFSDSSISSNMSRLRTRPQSLIFDDLRYIPEIEHRKTLYKLTSNEATSTSSLSTLVNPKDVGLEFVPNVSHRIRHTKSIANSDYNALNMEISKSNQQKQISNHSDIKHDKGLKNKNTNSDFENVLQPLTVDTIPNLIFSVGFHALNIILSIMFYLPIYIISRFKQISILLLIITFSIWYTNGWIWKFIPINEQHFIPV